MRGFGRGLFRGRKKADYSAVAVLGGRQFRVKLPSVSLVAVSSVRATRTTYALWRSSRNIKFSDVVFVSHKRPVWFPRSMRFVQCNQLRSVDDYSRFMLFDLCEVVKTDFVLVVQHDGYVARPDRWSDTYLSFDYIGASWPKGAHFTPEGREIRVGNGGFSLRSRRLLTMFRELDLPFSDFGTGFRNEDGQICVYNRSVLEKAGIRFAPVAIAQSFSLESDFPEPDSTKPFGFHSNPRWLPPPERFIYRVFWFVEWFVTKLMLSKPAG